MPEQRRTNRRNGKYGDMPLELAHVQPQAPEMEKAVLGALMIDRDAYMEVCNLLRVESFYEPRNQMVYEAIVKLSADESPVDVLTVTDMLAKMGKLDEVGSAVGCDLALHLNLGACSGSFDVLSEYIEVLLAAFGIFAAVRWPNS